MVEVPVGGVGDAETSTLDPSRAGSPRNHQSSSKAAKAAGRGLARGGCDAGLVVKVKSPKSKVVIEEGQGAAGTRWRPLHGGAHVLVGGWKGRE